MTAMFSGTGEQPVTVSNNVVIPQVVASLLALPIGWVEVRTKHGRRLHLRSASWAHPGWQGITTCGYAVAYVRQGGSWSPEDKRAWDHVGYCHRCLRIAGVGPEANG